MAEIGRHLFRRLVLFIAGLDSDTEMSSPQAPCFYSVVRGRCRMGYEDVALVRSSTPHGVQKRRLQKDGSDAVVLAHRTFRPMLELAAMEAYAAQLERAAAHGNRGTFGCFVDVDHVEDGAVRIALYDRWFDGERLRCEELTRREFDATEPGAVVSGAEFLAELRAWAVDRNEQRETNYLEVVAQERDRVERATERAEAARQLAEILASHA